MFGGSSGGAKPFFGLLLMETYGNPLAAVCWVQIDMSSKYDTPRFESFLLAWGLGAKSNIPHVDGAERSAFSHQDFACEHLYIAGQFAGVDGRMDHTLGAMNALYKAQAKGLNAALLSRGRPEEIHAIRTQCPSLVS